MGNFANTLFSALLGWVQSALAWVWGLFGSGGADGLMGWLLDNWLALTVVLCAAGVLIDLIMYLIRWQPYRVWRSFWHRGAGEAQEEGAQEPLQWLYADGNLVTQEPPQAPEVPQAQPELALEAPLRAPQRVIPARNRRTQQPPEGYVLPSGDVVQAAYHQPYYPPQWNTGEMEKTNGGTRS